MIVEPERYVDEFRAAGCDRITFHLEATRTRNACWRTSVRSARRLVSAINPQTPVAMLEDVIEDCDTVLVMSVNPGFGGQTFIARTLRESARSSGADRRRGIDCEIEVDGGIGEAERARSCCEPARRAGDGFDDFRRRGSRRGTAPHPLVVAVMAREAPPAPCAKTTWSRRSGRSSNRSRDRSSSWASATTRRSGSRRVRIEARSRPTHWSKACILRGNRCRCAMRAGARWQLMPAISPQWGRARYWRPSRSACRRRTSLADVRELYAGMAAAAARRISRSSGGTLSRAPVLTIAITAVGEVRASNAKTRAGGRPGAVLAVTGPLGAAAPALRSRRSPTRSKARCPARRSTRFGARKRACAEGRFLAASRNVQAMMDCSDGLSTDLDAPVCGQRLRSESRAVPVAEAARAFANASGQDPERYALAGGEDFELLVAVGARAFAHVAGRFPARFGRELLRIGTLRLEPGIALRDEPLERSGWDHFAS